MTTQSALWLHGVRAGYREQPVLAGIDLDLGPGFHVIVGANGAGKTTLFRVLAGVLTPSAGALRVLGEDPAAQRGIWRRVAYVSHRSGLHPALSVRDNLIYWGRVLGVAQIASQVDAVVGELALDDLLAKRAGTLSRGQSQRAGIARALLGAPDVLLLDEPTAGLDAAAGRGVRALLAGLSRSGRCIVCSTHNLHEASELADDVLLLADGRIRDQGSVDELARRLLGRRAVSLGVDRDPRAALESLGLRATRQGDDWLIDCPADLDIGQLVVAMVRDGIRVHRVREAGNPLDAIYLQLTSKKGTNDVSVAGAGARSQPPVA
jgi:ABC-type multidrug transport system ATPase subunit